MGSSQGPVLLTGATGLIGRRLVRRLIRSGRPLRAVSRSPARAGLPSEVDVLAWDGRAMPKQALAGSRAVVHLAGEPIFGGPMTEARRRRIRESREGSTRSLARAITELPAADRPEVLVCASAVGYYGSRGDDLLEEQEPPGEGFLARVCADWERAAAGVEAAGVRRVSPRIGIVLAAEGGALPPLLLPFKLGLGARLGDGRQWFPWVHVDDLTRLLETAIDDARYAGAVNAVSPRPVTNAQFTRALADALRRPAFLRVPGPLLRLAGREIAEELLGSRRVVPRAALDLDFGFERSELGEALAAEL